MHERLPGAEVTEVEVRVLVVEKDDGAARVALRVASGLLVTHTLAYETALEQVRLRRPHAIVLALSSLALADLGALKAFVSAVERVPVMVLSPTLPDGAATRLLKTGIGGLLFLPDARFLPTAVQELVRGGAPMSAPVSRLVLQRARRSSSSMAAVRPRTAEAKELLSQRQREILAFLQRGHSYEDIGSSLSLSVNTVRSHVRAIYERLGAANKVEAVMIGIELGLLESARPS
jgi:DNA-binding NarL/FixJ family response regulator